MGLLDRRADMDVEVPVRATCGRVPGARPGNRAGETRHLHRVARAVDEAPESQTQFCVGDHCRST